jgi:predicted membrane GTPase involved in stress response
VKKAAQASPVAGEVRATEGAEQVRLSDAAMSQSVAALRARMLDDPSFSMQLLKQAGIVNSRGRLAKSYGG